MNLAIELAKGVGRQAFAAFEQAPKIAGVAEAALERDGVYRAVALQEQLARVLQAALVKRLGERAAVVAMEDAP